MSIEFTEEELARILAGLTISSEAISELELLLVMADAIDLEALTNTILGTITGSEAPEVIAAARAAAERQARQISGNLARAELQKIANKVADNLAQGKNPRDLIKDLKEISGLDAQRAARLEAFKQSLINQVQSAEEIAAKVDAMHAKLLRDRRETIARTEQRNASSAGQQEIAKARGAQFKISISANDERVSEICETNQAQGYIPIDQPFESGDQQPTYHPNCRCSIAYRTEAPDAVDKAVSDERIAQTAEATP